MEGRKLARGSGSSRALDGRGPQESLPYLGMLQPGRAKMHDDRFCGSRLTVRAATIQEHEPEQEEEEQRRRQSVAVVMSAVMSASSSSALMQHRTYGTGIPSAG